MNSRFSDALFRSILDQEIKQNEALQNVSPVSCLIIDSLPKGVHNDREVGTNRENDVRNYLTTKWASENLL
jgi:hypothetical protein